jgi:hypothetical protein
MGYIMKLALILTFLFISCSQNFTQTHRLYSGAPNKTESVGYVQLGEAFMITRADWFEKHDALKPLTDSVIFSELAKTGNFSIIAEEEREEFMRETLKMDKTIFIKTRLPEQGVQIANYDYLFIIHEYTVGGDLEAENFYDYTKANLEMTQKKKIKNLSIIATFTLWDNKKQIPLKSGIISVDTPIKDNSFDTNLFINATKEVVKECLKKL